MPQKGNAGVVVGVEGPTPDVVKSEEKEKFEVGAGGQEPTPAGVKSGAWLTAGDMAMSDPWR